MENPHIKVTVTLDDRKVTLEGPEDFVKAEVQRLTTPMVQGNTAAPQKQSSARPPDDSPETERDLIAGKQPKNHSETVAVLGFCLTENGQEEFTEADIKRAYRRAEVRPPKVIAQALRDAKNNFDYIETGSKRGTYKLSAHGDRTVRFDLPRSDPKTQTGK